jgi:hypothetical protein
MSFTSFKEQFKNVILEYLSPEAYKARLQKSTDYTNSDRGELDPRYSKPRDKVARQSINKLSKVRNNRVAKVRKGRDTLGDKIKSSFGVPGEKGPRPTRLKKKGFDAVDKSPKDFQVNVRGFRTGWRGESPDRDSIVKPDQINKEGAKLRRPYSRRLSQDPALDYIKPKGRAYEEQFKNVILNYLNEWTAEGVMKAAKKRGYHPDGDDDETGNTRDVNSRHDAGKTTRVTKNDDGTVTVDRSDASKYQRDSKGKTIKGKFKRRSRSDPKTKKVIKP